MKSFRVLTVDRDPRPRGERRPRPCAPHPHGAAAAGVPLHGARRPHARNVASGTGGNPQRSLTLGGVCFRKPLNFEMGVVLNSASGERQSNTTWRYMDADIAVALCIAGAAILSAWMFARRRR